MKPVYLYEIGIRPWEQTKSVGNATVTIVQKSVGEIFSLWLEHPERYGRRQPGLRRQGQYAQGTRGVWLRQARNVAWLCYSPRTAPPASGASVEVWFDTATVPAMSASSR